MKALKCECCGAAINPINMKCEYCGVRYKKDGMDNVIRIEAYENPCHEYASQVCIPRENIRRFGEELTSKQAVKQLSMHLAEAIAPNMKLETRYDPIEATQIITARVRIVEPKYDY